MARAPIASVRGDTKVFVTEPTQLAAALGASDSDRGVRSHGPTGAGVPAEFSDIVMQATSQESPLVMKSLRDIIYHHKKDLPHDVVRKMTAVNMAYSLLRHNTADQLVGFAHSAAFLL